MSTAFLSPFVKAATTVLATETGAAAAVDGDVFYAQAAYTPSDITVLLGVVGDVQGVVLYSMETSMALKIVSTMLGQEHHEFDDLAQSGIAEMSNVITGVATTYLADSGYRCSISVPTLVLGRQTKIATVDFKRLIVPMSTSIGKLAIHLSLREEPKRSVLLYGNGAGKPTRIR